MEEQSLPPSTTSHAPSLMGESMLSQLRSRLDPIYNPPPPPQSSSLPPVRLPPLGHPTSESPVPSPTEERDNKQASVEDDKVVPGHSGKSGRGSRRRTKQRRADDAQLASPKQPDPEDGVQNELTREQASTQHDELKSTSRDALITGTPGSSERKKHKKRRDKDKARRTPEHDAHGDTQGAVENASEVTGEQTLDASHGMDDDGLPLPSIEGTIPAYT